MIAVGAECYNHGASPSTGTGRLWNAEELGAAIDGQVSALVFDVQGKADIQELLVGSWKLLSSKSNSSIDHSKRCRGLAGR